MWLKEFFAEYQFMIIGITAIAALFFTLLQTRVTQRHNRLSVKPHLNITIETIDQKDFCVRLTNHGTGPAIIKKYTIFLNKEKKDINSRDDLILVLEKIKLAEEWVHGYALSKDQGISAGDSIFLFNFHLELHRGDRKKLFKESMKKLRFQIEYESIYEEKFVLK